MGGIMLDNEALGCTESCTAIVDTGSSLLVGPTDQVHNINRSEINGNHMRMMLQRADR